MRIKNAFKILISNSTVIYKTVFYKLITSSIIILLAYLCIAGDVRPILQSKEINDFWDAIIATLTTFINGDGINRELLPQSFDAVLAMLKNNTKDIFLAFLEVGLFMFVLNLFERIGNYAIGFLTNGFMSSLSKYSLVATLFANFGKAFLYAIIITPIVMIFDGIVLTLAVLIGVYGIRFISVFAIILSLIFVVVVLSCKYAILSRFMPALITDKKPVGEAFKYCFTKREKYWAMVGNYAFVIMIAFYLNVSVAVFTLGAGLIVSLPLSLVFITIVAFVDHYQIEGKKYYASGEEVVTPRQMREHAELLKYM